MKKPAKLTSAPEGFEYYKICDPEGMCHVVKGMQKVQLLMAEMPELIVTKMPAHWSTKAAALSLPALRWRRQQKAPAKAGAMQPWRLKSQ